jgi:hypothetical protein
MALQQAEHEKEMFRAQNDFGDILNEEFEEFEDEDPDPADPDKEDPISREDLIGIIENGREEIDLIRFNKIKPKTVTKEDGRMQQIDVFTGKPYQERLKELKEG